MPKRSSPLELKRRADELMTELKEMDVISIDTFIEIKRLQSEARNACQRNPNKEEE